MKPITINYESLREWMRLNKSSLQVMASTATEWGAPVSAASLGKYIRTGSAIPSTIIVAWRNAYKWTAEEVAHLLMNGPMPFTRRKGQSEAEAALKVIAQALKPYLEEEANEEHLPNEMESYAERRQISSLAAGAGP